MKRIVILGGGFAGLWAALGAARKRAELGLSEQQLEITVIDRNPFHSIRVRNYEPDLTDTIIDFDEVLRPVDVNRIEAEVEGLEPLN